MLKGDVTRLTQIQNNILSNALKFTKETGLVSARYTYDFDKNMLTIVFADTGMYVYA